MEQLLLNLHWSVILSIILLFIHLLLTIIFIIIALNKESLLFNMIIHHPKTIKYLGYLTLHIPSLYLICFVIGCLIGALLK